MREAEKSGDNGAADLFTVDILASRVQTALGRVQAVAETIRRLLAQAKQLERTLQDAESDLHVANQLATFLQPKPVDEGDRRLRDAIVIAAGGHPDFPVDGNQTFREGCPPPPRRKRGRPRGTSRRESPDGTAA